MAGKTVEKKVTIQYNFNCFVNDERNHDIRSIINFNSIIKWDELIFNPARITRNSHQLMLFMLQAIQLSVLWNIQFHLYHETHLEKFPPKKKIDSRLAEKMIDLAFILSGPRTKEEHYN